MRARATEGERERGRNEGGLHTVECMEKESSSRCWQLCVCLRLKW